MASFNHLPLQTGECDARGLPAAFAPAALDRLPVSRGRGDTEPRSIVHVAAVLAHREQAAGVLEIIIIKSEFINRLAPPSRLRPLALLVIGPPPAAAAPSASSHKRSWSAWTFPRYFQPGDAATRH
ncbi:unnamed protein product [Pleuronectes platessa]|uniref:Uncharacterized protein n=1 Tax=Pleuronectes platessa TaxID=8262 RepID=A0A9N7YZM4_PLEPL|nr:unnamed protein product [Pleuronectes platessa]